MPEEPAMDRLTGQLYHLPAIVGQLGISVANAQKVMNADYIQNMSKLLHMIKEVLGTNPDAATLKELLVQMAPSRYQFSETTLEFNADLSERSASEVTAAIGGGFGGVMLSAGYARSFAYDYRAAARVSTILHAIPADEKITGPLLAQADKIGDQTLPPKTDVEKDLLGDLKQIGEALQALQPPETTTDNAGTGNPES